MQITNLTIFARALADAMIAERFSEAYGVYTLDAYIALVDERSTQHLSNKHALRMGASSRHQRASARLTVESGEVVIHVPVHNPNTREHVSVSLDLATWLDLMEMGASTAWRYRVKGNGRQDGQVDCSIPLTGKTATIARLIRNAKPGQRAKTRDGNPLNLRNSNLYLLGVPYQSAKVSKTDTAARMKDQAALQRSLAGAEYDYIPEGAVN